MKKDAQPGDGLTAGAAASRRVLLQGSLYTVAAAAPILVAILITPAVTRILGEHEYGAVGLGLVIIQVATVVLSLGFAEPIARHGILEGSGIRGAKALVLQAIPPSLAITIATCLTSPLWAGSVLGTMWRWAWPIALVGSFLFGIVINIQAVLRVLDRPGIFVLMSLIASFGGPAMGLGLSLLLDRTAEAYGLGLLAGYVVAMAIGAPVIVTRGDRPRAQRGDFRVAARLGMPMISNQIALYLATATLAILAVHTGDLSDGGRMQLALFVGSSPAVIALAMSNSWAPLIYRTPAKDRAEVLGQTARHVGAVIAVLAVGLALLSPLVLRLLAPASFGPDVLARAAAVASCASVPTVAYLASVHSIMTTRRNWSLGVIAPACTAGALLALVLLGDRATFGIIAAGLPVAYLLMASVAVVVARRVSQIAWPVSALAGWFAFSLVGAGCGFWLGTDRIGWILRLVLAVGVGLFGIVYLQRSLRGGPGS